MKASSFVASVPDPTNLNSCTGFTVSILKLGSLSVDFSNSESVTDSSSNSDLAVVFAILKVHNICQNRERKQGRETKGGRKGQSGGRINSEPKFNISHGPLHNSKI